MTNETIALVVAIVVACGGGFAWIITWLSRFFQQNGEMVAELKGIRAAVEGVKLDVSEVKESVTRAHERIDVLMQREA